MPNISDSGAMAPQSYELSFVGSMLVIFIAIVLFIVAANLLVTILRFAWRKVFGQARLVAESSTQTLGEGDGSTARKAERQGSMETAVSSTENKKKE